MAKLQKIIRKNGSQVYSVNIPLLVIEEIEWDKGKELEVTCGLLNGVKTILVKEKDGSN